MKKLVILILLFVTVTSYAKQPPFKKGVNITEWFQKDTASAIQFTRFTKKDFENIKSLGCDHIRLPLNLLFMSGDAPDYTLDPLFFYFLDKVITWAEDLDMYLILDNHSFIVEEDTSPEIEARLVSVWTQMARRYKDTSKYVMYEVLNEPHGIGDAAWNAIQQHVVEAIRTEDTKHTIVIGPAGWNSYNNLALMPVYADTNLIYTFHFYDPMLFTHQGAGWTNPGNDIANVPYPYDAARMPALPALLKGTWWESEYNSYKNINLGSNCPGNVAYVKKKIDIAVNFANARNVPIWCGEFGVYQPHCLSEDRARWIQTVREYFESNNIAWSMWEYSSGFGIFESGSSGMFDYDVEIPIVQAMGLNIPPQQEYVKTPDETGMTLYDDFVGAYLVDNSWLTGNVLNFYSTDAPLAGEFCLEFANAPIYTSVSFKFQPVRDFSWLVDHGYALDFWVRSDFPDMAFDIRFLDTKLDNGVDHPWRNRIKVNNNMAEFDGTWQHIQVPLSDFTEHGSWDDDQWFNPEGLFDWTNVELFQIVSEQIALTDMSVYFDRIRVVDPAVVSVQENVKRVNAFTLEQNYPNPFNPATNIRFTLPEQARVNVAIYNSAGRLVETLLNGRVNAGEHTITWNAGQVSSGIYFYQIKTDKVTAVKKCVLIK